MYGLESVPLPHHSRRHDVMTIKSIIGVSEIQRIEIKAIRLWSDWNLGLKKWAMEKVKSVR